MEVRSALPNFTSSQLSLALRMGSCALLGQDSQSKGVNHGTHSLLTMERGGIHDHVGGGYARYSVDERWHVPHFEKMLYDNAQILGVSAEAWAQQRHPAMKRSVQGVVSFLERELHDVSGGFKSAMDADSDGEEGAYYGWREADLAVALPEAACGNRSRDGLTLRRPLESKHVDEASGERRITLE